MFRSVSLCLLLSLAVCSAQKGVPGSFHFVIVGDRTGETLPGVYERVLMEAAATDPAFILTMGDTIQGYRDATAEAEWREADKMLAPYRRFPLYLTPGNHDVWNAASASLFRKHAGRELHYSFDYGSAHFTVLDNSRTETYTADEIAFLIDDLKAHRGAPLKFIVSHKPLWVFPVMANSQDFELHRIAKQFGVQYVLAGHLHGLFTAEMDGVTYISVPSAGGNLRASGRYEDGWFYGYLPVSVNGTTVATGVREIGGPIGKGRSTALTDWGKTGLLHAR